MKTETINEIEKKISNVVTLLETYCFLLKEISKGNMVCPDSFKIRLLANIQYVMQELVEIHNSLNEKK